MKEPATQTKAPEAAPMIAASPPKAPPSSRTMVHSILQLSRKIGNQSVQRLIQAKLTIGQLDDLSKVEADDAAQTILRMSDMPAQRLIDLGQMDHRASPFGASVGDGLAQRIKAARGGSQLDVLVQGQLEQGLGADLSNVRLHTDSEADRLARAVSALAFTSGQDIFFRQGAYNPSSQSGMHLLAHEAFHTIQQAAGPVAGIPVSGGVSISVPGDDFERAAEQAADWVTPAGRHRAGPLPPQIPTAVSDSANPLSTAVSMVSGGDPANTIEQEAHATGDRTVSKQRPRSCRGVAEVNGTQVRHSGSKRMHVQRQEIAEKGVSEWWGRFKQQHPPDVLLGPPEPLREELARTGQTRQEAINSVVGRLGIDRALLEGGTMFYLGTVKAGGGMTFPPNDKNLKQQRKVANKKPYVQIYGEAFGGGWPVLISTIWHEYQHVLQMSPKSKMLAPFGSGLPAEEVEAYCNEILAAEEQKLPEEQKILVHTNQGDEELSGKEYITNVLLRRMHEWWAKVKDPEKIKKLQPLVSKAEATANRLAGG